MADRDLTPEEIEVLRKISAKHDEEEAELAHAVGIFSMRFAKLEQCLNFAIGDFLGLRNVSMTLMLTAAIQNLNIRFNILSSLVNGSRMSDDLRSNLRKCLTEFRTLNDYRNWLLHNTFEGKTYTITDDQIESPNTWRMWRPRTDTKFHFQDEEFTIDEILKRATVCGVLGTKLTTFTRQYVGEREKLYSSQ